MKICIISDDFSPPYDEGFKKIAYHVSKEFAFENHVLAIGRRGQDVPFPLEIIETNPLFLNQNLRKRLRAFNPQLIVYIPLSSCTRNSFFRCKLLKVFCPNTRLAMIAVQSRAWRQWEIPLIRWWQPDLVLTPLPEVLNHLKSLAIFSDYLPFGVDFSEFCISPKDLDRMKLRKKYGIGTKDKVYLHVGQITEKRNVRLLSRLQRDGRQVIIIGSSSSASLGFPHDLGLIKELREKGVKVWVEHFPHIQEIYKLADCYIFPVFNETGGIGFPLSIVESLASGTPVVTTRFGGLEMELKGSPAIRYANTNEEIVSLALKEKDVSGEFCRATVNHLGWESIAKRIVDSVMK